MWARAKSWLTPLVTLALAEVAAGTTLRFNVDLLVYYPVLLILIPGLMDLRGNVYGALGYRLAKSLHLGLAQPRFWSKYNAVNTATGYAVSVVATITLSLLGLALSYIALLRALDVTSLLFITLASTALVFVFLTPLTVVTINYLFTKGRDPSSFVATIVTGIGDFATPAVLITVYHLHVILPLIVKVAFVIVVVATAVLAVVYAVRAGGGKDFLENLYSSVIASTGSSLGGFFLATRVEFVGARPEMLGVLPAFNAVTGAAMGYLGSTLNIELHLGFRDPKSTYSTEAKLGFIVTYVSILIALILLTAVSRLPEYGFLANIAALTLSLAVVYLAASLLTYTLATLTFKHGWDPDNVVFPVMTTVVDLMGPVVLSTIGSLILV